MYKNFLYRILTKLSPNFDNYIVNKLKNKELIKILDVGFYTGNFSKTLIKKINILNKNTKFIVFSFDPNKSLDLETFNNFANKENVDWHHNDFALGNNKELSDFTVLNAFPPSGSSLNNILKDSFWYKTRKLIFSLFQNIKEEFSTYKVEVETIDNQFKLDSNFNILKIDVEGYSLEVLSGAKEFIERNNLILQVEILSHKKDFLSKEEELLKFIYEYNYQLIDKKRHYTSHFFSDVICVDYLFEK
tara:strand:+ start:34 stop:771 length:738 start_codon:yes stop_codon:yes gene_type:complete